MGAYIILAVFLIVIIMVTYAQIRQKNEYLREGWIIRRQAYFWEDTETLYCKSSYRDMLAELKNTDFPYCGVTITTNVGGKATVLFEIPSWKAELNYYGETDGEHEYEFQFTSWKKENYVVQDSMKMNLLQTAVEKMFLRLDPDTEAKIHRNKIQSKTSFI